MPDRHDVLELLDGLGLAVGANGVEMIDFDLAGGVRGPSPYAHHTQIPVALVGYAMVMPAFAIGRFPDITLIQLVRKRPSMDEREVVAFAAVCGVKVSPPFWGNPEPFVDFLHELISRHDLFAFFDMEGQPEGSRLHSIRPRGYDWADPMWPEIPGVIARWRKDYRALPPARQIMVATIMQLYMQRDDTTWMVRVPKKWHAAEAVEILRDAGGLKDWARLIALYPGW